MKEELDKETSNFKKQTETTNETLDKTLDEQSESSTAQSTDEIPFIITNLEGNAEKAYDYESQIITEKANEESANNKETMQPATTEVEKDSEGSTASKHTQPEMEQDNENIIPQKKSHKKLIWGCVTAVILVTALSATGWSFYSEIKAAERQEALDFAVLCEENYNIEDYQNFLDKYAQSEHCRNVRQRLNELKRMAEDWKAIEHSQNENSFVEYKNKYNDPFYSRLCNLKIDTIDWQRAKAANTPDAYQHYLSLHPNGVYMSDAIVAKSEVAYMNISEQEQAEIKQRCNQFFAAIGVNNTAELELYFAPQVTLFMGLENPAIEDIIAWTTKNQENHSFVNYFIHDDLKMSKEINEYNKEYFNLTFTIDQITTNETGEETTQPYEATLLMDKEHLVYSLAFKQI